MKQIDALGFSKVFLRQLVFIYIVIQFARISLSNHLFLIMVKAVVHGMKFAICCANSGIFPDPCVRTCKHMCKECWRE